MKLGLIAMSGLRAHNEELTRLGLTLPGAASIPAAAKLYTVDVLTFSFGVTILLPSALIQWP